MSLSKSKFALEQYHASLLGESAASLDDPQLAAEIVKNTVPARAKSKSFAVSGKTFPFAIQMSGSDIKKKSARFSIAFTGSPGKYVALVSKDDGDPTKTPAARHLVQAARMAARQLEKIYMGESFCRHGVILSESDAGEIKWKMDDNRAFADVAIGDEKFTAKIMWFPDNYGTGSKRRTYRINIDLFPKGNKGMGNPEFSVHGTKFQLRRRPGWPLRKAPSGIAKKNLKKVAISEFDGMVSDFKKAGLDIKVS